MTPVMQTRPDVEDGNCLQASIASILDRPINDVPDMPLRGPGWFHAYGRLLAKHGIWFAQSSYPPAAGAYIKVSAHIEDGKVDFAHCAVYEDGQLVHDPTPGWPIERMRDDDFYYLVVEQLWE